VRGAVAGRGGADCGALGTALSTFIRLGEVSYQDQLPVVIVSSSQPRKPALLD
jgi:hypothetical protein